MVFIIPINIFDEFFNIPEIKLASELTTSKTIPKNPYIDSNIKPKSHDSGPTNGSSRILIAAPPSF